MAVATTEPGTIRTAAFTYKGTRFPATSLTKDIEFLGTGEPAYKLGSKSITLGYQAALFEVALLSQLGIDTSVSKEVKDVAVLHYATITSEENRGRGNWNNTGVDYDTDLGRPNPWFPEGYERLGLVNNPEWVKENDIWTLKKNAGELIVTDVPPIGFVIPTNDGLYQPSGFPYATVPEREAAIEIWTKFLINRKPLEEKPASEFAKKHVSRFYRRQKGQGCSAVFRDYYLDDGGPFCEHAHWGADDRGRDLGAFPLRSSGKKK